MLFFPAATAQKKHLIYVTWSESFWKIFFSQSDQRLPVSKCSTLQSSHPAIWHTEPSNCTTVGHICQHLLFSTLQV